MRKFTLFSTLSLLILLNLHVSAQNKESATYFAKLITAYKYLSGDGLPCDTTKAFTLYKDCAENGKMPEAMISLGKMYKLGHGTKKDLKKAFSWFSKAADTGNAKAIYHMGLMYKLGESVPQDFSIAYSKFKESADLGFSGGIYGAGYCSYKGLGTQQDYHEAAKWFTEGHQQNNASCTFMLGICYRNGFGVEQNEQKAKEFIEIANKYNVAAAKKELSINYPEISGINPNKETGTDNNNTNNGNNKEKFKKLIKHQSDISLNGEWGGTRYIYDWSGEHILNQIDLYVTFEQNGNAVKGQWKEDNKLVVKFNGKIIDDQIIFNGSKFCGKNRYGEKIPMEFTSAIFESINADVNYLTGNIESYSPKTKEPGRPCYVVMSKLQEKSATIDSIDVKDIITENISEVTDPVTVPDSLIVKPVSQDNLTTGAEDTIISQTGNKQQSTTGNYQREALDYFRDKEANMIVYPNPFKNSINVSYSLENQDKVSILIYNNNGSIIFQKDLGMTPAGRYSEKINLTATSGQYIVRLTIGNQNYSKVIIKK